MEPLNQVNLMLARGRSFWIVSQAETICDFPIIRATGPVAHALYVELLERFTFEEEQNELLFNLACDTLFVSNTIAYLLM